MATTCPECSKKFTARTALCEDWQNPERSFGCPHCGTFFVKDMNPNRKKEWIETLFIVGIILPSVNIVFRHFFQGIDPVVFVNALSILIAATIIIALKMPKFLSPLVRSPYKKSLESQSNW